MPSQNIIAQRAIERQLEYQRNKAANVSSAEDMADFKAYSENVFAKLRPFADQTDLNGDVLEVGSGAHGHIFFWDAKNAVGVDPLANEYRQLFPLWQQHAKTFTAFGENLNFPDESFDLVISDNVVDHAEDPSRILAEIFRVLRPGGKFYFKVNYHHPIYNFASLLLHFLRRLGVPFEVGPFADHTFHFTLKQVKALMRREPFEILMENFDSTEALGRARTQSKRHLGDYLKTWFFKNAVYEAILAKR